MAAPQDSTRPWMHLQFLLVVGIWFGPHPIDDRERLGVALMKKGTQKTIRGLIAMVILAIITPPLCAEGGSLIPNVSTTKGPVDVGAIFNTSNLLFGLESYQAGLGAKIGWGKLDLRGLFDFTINGSSQSYAVDLGTTVEYHFIPGPVSPYVGASVSLGYMTQSNITSAVTGSLGAVAGIEVFILDFLSVFAEYEVAADLTDTTDLQTSQSTFDYLINTRMGNNASLGVVIYFMRSEAKTK